VDRRNVLRLAAGAAAGLVTGCTAESQPDETSAVTPAVTSAPATTEKPPIQSHSPVDAYVPNWLDPEQYAAMQANLRPGDLRRLYVAFAIPNVMGGVLLDQTPAGLVDLVHHLGENTKVSLSVGGYGDTAAPAKSPSSRSSVLAGWEAALQDPQGFTAKVAAARAALGLALGRPGSEIGLDLDFEYPSEKQRGALTYLVGALRPTVQASLTMAVPARDNLGGFDIDKLTPTIDRFNVMTYAYGRDTTPAMVVRDVRDWAERADSTKIAVGYSTELTDASINTPAAFGDIHRQVQDVGANGSFVWTTEGLTPAHLTALSS